MPPVERVTTLYIAAARCDKHRGRVASAGLTVLQEYLIGSAIIPAHKCDTMREALRPLLLPGQIKLHWTDESKARKRAIVDRVCELEPVSVVIAHLSERHRKTERFRRKCREVLYQELLQMEVHDLTLESRSRSQDNKDRAHIVALQGQGLGRSIRISHLRGGDEPLLWIADAVLGAINSAPLGEEQYLEALPQRSYSSDEPRNR